MGALNSIKAPARPKRHRRVWVGTFPKATCCCRVATVHKSAHRRARPHQRQGLRNTTQHKPQHDQPRFCRQASKTDAGAGASCAGAGAGAGAASFFMRVVERLSFSATAFVPMASTAARTMARCTSVKRGRFCAFKRAYWDLYAARVSKSCTSSADSGAAAAIPRSHPHSSDATAARTHTRSTRFPASAR